VRGAPPPRTCRGSPRSARRGIRGIACWRHIWTCQRCARSGSRLPRTGRGSPA